MSDKSYVTMESKLCVTCGCEYSTGSLLMDMRLRKRFERDTLNGWGLCDAHTKAADEGYVAMIEVDASKSDRKPDGTMDNDGAYRTGRVVLIKREALNAVLDNPIPERAPIIYIDQAAFEKILPPEVLANAPEERERSTTGDIAPGSESIN